MAVKRRVIWMDDGEWARLASEALEAELTISAYVRSLASKREAMPHAVKEDFDRFNRRPFTPVPKKGK
jgi:hypothetical protein